MLVLTRFPGQEIRIGDNITIGVLGLNDDGQVRLGIIAPPNVLILRAEVKNRNNEDNSREEKKDNLD